MSEPMTDTKAYVIYTDGGSRGNPGPAAFGYVIYNPQGEIMAESGHCIGVTTNNQAEYQAIVAALKKLHELQPDAPVICKLDSQLVVRQINGQYRMKNAELKPWYDEVLTLKQTLNQPIQFIDIPRAQNAYADALVNAALDGHEKK